MRGRSLTRQPPGARQCDYWKPTQKTQGSETQRVPGADRGRRSPTQSAPVRRTQRDRQKDPQAPTQRVPGPDTESLATRYKAVRALGPDAENERAPCPDAESTGYRHGEPRSARARHKAPPREFRASNGRRRRERRAPIYRSRQNKAPHRKHRPSAGSQCRERRIPT